MQIRITSELVQHGTVQFTRGQVLDLPEELAQQFVDAGDAEPVDLPAVRASVAGFAPPSPRAAKGRRR